jgi:hypothetical protein
MFALSPNQFESRRFWLHRPLPDTYKFNLQNDSQYDLRLRDV